MTKPTALDLGRNAKQAMSVATMSVAMQQFALVSESEISQNSTHPSCIPVALYVPRCMGSKIGNIPKCFLGSSYQGH